jgi:hypothetical protein
MIMSRLPWMVMVTAALGACAYPDFQFNGTTSTSSSSGGGGPSCKVTHPGGGTCEYLPGKECGCSGDQKCTVVDPKTGESACVSAGSTPDYARCTTSADCASGSWCDMGTLVCEPICEGSCTNGFCAPAMQGGTSNATIPGLSVCTVTCDLASAHPCGSNATCILLEDSQGHVSGSECAASANITEGMGCMYADDCAAGLGCIYNDLAAGYFCMQWCSPIGSECTGNDAGLTCLDPGQSVKVGGKTYGYCG